MVVEEDFSKDVLDSLQDAAGRKVKMSLRKKVQLDVKGDKQESRILALAPHRVFLLTARVPARIEQSFNFFDIQAISSNKPGQLVVDYDKGQLCLKLGSNEEVDEVITQIGVSIQEHCPGLNPLRVMKKLSLKPTERVARLQEYWEKNPPSDTGPCGAFSHMYWCICDQIGLPYRAEVQWDVDTIYLSQDTRELNLQDFIHLETRDLMAIIAVLEYNQWFTKLSLKDYKLSTDLCDQILRVVARSSRLEELALENTGLKADFAMKLSSALSQNPHSALHTLNLASNSVEDKGIASLSSPLGKLPSGLKHLNLAKNSLSSKGVNILAQAMCSNPSVANTLTHLDLSGNTLRGDDMSNLWNFLGQPNKLHTLDLSNCDCSVDLVCSSLARGSLKHLSVLNMSKSVFSIKRGKELPGSFKQFFSCALALNTIVLSGTKLPPEALKALLLGLACNPNLKDVTLDLSSCELRSAGSQILEGCIAEIPNVSILDISDNGLDSDLMTLLVWLAKNRSIRQLSLGKNFNNIKSKNLGQVLNSLVLMIQEEESPLNSLSLADSKLKADLSIVLNAIGGNSSLTRLDISGNAMGDMGAKILAKALQINTKLRTVFWDRNNVSAQGLQDVASALEKNYTIRFMPVPIMDAAQALKSNPEKTEDALMKMEQYLLRNHETRKYLQEQAYRLQQGIITSTTQQMIDRLCVKVQDHLNSLRFSEREKVQDDMRTAERLVQDARNSKRLLASMYHHTSSQAGGSGDGGGGLGESSDSLWVEPIQEKLESMAGEVSTVIDKQLQSLLVSMVDTAERVCPHVMRRANLKPVLIQASEGRMSVPRPFITNTLLEQSAVDIINKISELKLSMASFLSDRILDEILESLSRSQHVLAEHLSKRGRPLTYHEAQETEDLDEKQLETESLPSPPADLLLTPTSKRQSILFRMVRPISAAFELEYDLDKALELVPIHLDDSSVLPKTVEAVEVDNPEKVCFGDLPDTESPKLEHVTKLRPRRKKSSKPSKSPPFKIAPAELEEENEFVGKLDEGVDDFYAKKVTKIGARRFSGKDVGVELERKRESRMSGFFNLIKSRSLIKSPPPSPHTGTTSSTSLMTQATVESDVPDHSKRAVKSPIPESEPTCELLKIADEVEPCEHVDAPIATEPKGHVEEGKKRDGPPVPRIRGVQVMGNDFLAQLRAKQEKMKEKTSESSSSSNKAEPDHSEGDTGTSEKPVQREHQAEAASKSKMPQTLLKPTGPAHAPAAKHTPVPTHVGLKASFSPHSISKSASGRPDRPSSEHLPSPQLPKSPLNSSSTPEDVSGHPSVPASPSKPPVMAQHRTATLPETELQMQSPVHPSNEDVFPPPITPGYAVEGSEVERESFKLLSQTPTPAPRSISLNTSTSSTGEKDDQQSLPAQALESATERCVTESESSQTPRPAPRSLSLNTSTSSADEKDDRQRTMSLPAQDVMTPTKSAESPCTPEPRQPNTKQRCISTTQHTDSIPEEYPSSEDDSED